MKWVETKIVFDHPDKDLAVDLISDLFYDFGLQGVVVEDPRIEPEEGWPEDVIGRPDHYTVTGYFSDDNRIFFFFFNDTATTEIYTLSYTLSLHDALPI